MKEIIACAVSCSSLFIYLIFSGIEFGSSIFSVFPKLIHKKDSIANYVNPIWETTTVFLVFALTSLIAIFPGAIIIWGTDLFPITFTFLLIFGVRILCILLMHYADIKSKILDVVYFLTSFIVPSLFALILLYFFTGSWRTYLTSPLYIWLVLATVTGVVTISLTFFRAYQKNISLTRLVRASGTLFFLTVVFFWLNMGQNLPYLFAHSTVVASTAIIMILFIILTLIAEWLENYTAVFLTCIAFVASLFGGLFVAHLPYIVYPINTIYSSVTNTASFNFIIGSFIVGIIIVAPALVLLYKLFILDTTAQITKSK